MSLIFSQLCQAPWISFLLNLNVIQFLPFPSICLPCLCAGCFGSITLQCLLRLCFISINPTARTNHQSVLCNNRRHLDAGRAKKGAQVCSSSSTNTESHLKAFQEIQPDAYAGFLDRILLASLNKILCISLKICLDGVCAGWLLWF